MTVLPNRFALMDHIGIAGKTCAEIGVFEGEFSREILARHPASLLLVDPWKTQSKKAYPNDPSNVLPDKFERIFDAVNEEFGRLPNVTICREFSYFAAPPLPSFDFIYIDANHTFNNCFCDILTWYKSLRTGGWICGHDYTGDYIGVKYAVEAFCQISGEELGLVTNEFWGSWGIRKSKTAEHTSSTAGRSPS